MYFVETNCKWNDSCAPTRWSVVVGGFSDEAVVEWETVADGVLPATADVGATVVRERRHDRRIDLSQRTSVQQRTPS